MLHSHALNYRFALFFENENEFSVTIPIPVNGLVALLLASDEDVAMWPVHNFQFHIHLCHAIF